MKRGAGAGREPATLNVYLLQLAMYSKLKIGTVFCDELCIAYCKDHVIARMTAFAGELAFKNCTIRSEHDIEMCQIKYKLLHIKTYLISC